MWLVQSVTEPSGLVFNMKHGQVMISKCDSTRAGMAEFGSVIGPQSTVDLCSTAPSSDPWLQHDPWQQALAQTPAAPRQNVPAQVQNLQAQMMSQMEVQRTHMASMFDDQMSKLETILAKKGRYE